jgi:hypothetical protein
LETDNKIAGQVSGKYFIFLNPMFLYETGWDQETPQLSQAVQAVTSIWLFLSLFYVFKSLH